MDDIKKKQKQKPNADPSIMEVVNTCMYIQYNLIYMKLKNRRS